MTHDPQERIFEQQELQIERPHSLSSVFLGSEGLRSGWSVLLFLVIVILVGVIARTLLSFLLHDSSKTGASHGQVTLANNLMTQFAAVSIVLIATAVMARLEKKSVTSYGLGGRNKLSLFLRGAFWGFLFLSILIGALLFTHNLVLTSAHLSVIEIWKYGLGWLVAMLGVGIFEETLIRGYLQWTLARGLGFWWGALLLAILFGLLHGHNAGESPVGLFAAAAIGFVFSLSIWYTGSLWWAIGFHATWDWGEMYFYGTPNSGVTAEGHFLTAHPLGNILLSGGATGPEGSLLVLPTIALMAVLLYFTVGPRPQWTEESTPKESLPLQN